MKMNTKEYEDTVKEMCMKIFCEGYKPSKLITNHKMHDDHVMNFIGFVINRNGSESYISDFGELEVIIDPAMKDWQVVVE